MDGGCRRDAPSAGVAATRSRRQDGAGDQCSRSARRRRRPRGGVDRGERRRHRRPGRADRRPRRERAGRRRVLLLGVHAEQGAAARHRGARRGPGGRRRGAGGHRRAGRRGDAGPARRLHLALGRLRPGEVGPRRRHRPDPRHRPPRRRAHRRRRRPPTARGAAHRPARGRGVHRVGGRRARRSTGSDAIDAWTPREATSAKEAPGRLLILGGGVRRLRDGHRLAGPRARR